MFIVDMNTPGITVKPLINMAGTHAFNEVFFDDVRVSKNCLVGEKNRGWMLLTAGLGLERTGSGGGPGDAARAKRCLDDLVKYVKETVVNGQPLSKNPIVRQKLARMAMEIEVSRLLSYRPAWFAAQGIESKFEASISKLFGSELGQRVAQTETEITGLKGLLRPESPRAVIGGRSSFDYMFTWVRIFGGGTTDIQRNIISIRHLGLPSG
jgi:alkylation response protein AidB-like acyl-CoA dehydrogenase